MKSKFICLLAMLFAFNLAASPNRKCDGIRTAGIKMTEKITDDSDLLPHQTLLNRI